MRSSLFGILSTTALLCLFGQSAAKAQGHELGLKERHFGRPRSAHSTELTSHNGTATLTKRFDSTKFSYYAAGLGACGKVNSPSDFIVALNQAQWDGGSHCFEMITITYNGKTAQAQVTDMCPGCPYGGLDFSEGLFSHFASTDAGIIYGSWVFGAGKPDPPKTTSQEPTTTKAPKTSSTPPPPPSTTETPTSTKASSSALTSTSASPSSTTSSVTPSSTSAFPTSTTESHAPTSTTQSIVPSATPTPQSPEALALFNQAFFLLGGLIDSAASTQS